MKSELNNITKRFIDLYDEIILRKFIRNQTELAEKLGTYTHIMGQIIKGKKNLTLDMLNKLVSLSGEGGEKINPSYILTGTGNQFILQGAQNALHQTEVTLKEERIEILEGTLKDHQREIELLKAEVAMLKQMMELQKQINDILTKKTEDSSSSFSDDQDREAV